MTTSRKPKPVLWPPDVPGLQQGELYAIVSRPPEQLLPEELEELELRALALLNRRGKRDLEAVGYWRRNSLLFETPYLMLVSNDHCMNVRVCDGRPGKDGLMLYTSVYEKQKAGNEVWHRASTARIALQHMRDLMILDDLASL